MKKKKKLIKRIIKKRTPAPAKTNYLDWMDGQGSDVFKQ
jgi:hypothetical protein